jgi:hypothetical protein
MPPVPSPISRAVESGEERVVESKVHYERHVWSMVLDEACRSVSTHLDEAGFDFIVLKGATIAEWLYPDPSQRTYLDLDILVAPQAETAVVASLEQIGYRPLLDERSLRPFSPDEQPLRGPSDVMVDLHIALQGVHLPAEEAWEILFASTVLSDWAGTPIRALAPPARAMLLALHLAKRGLVDAQAARDLRLGLERLDEDLWREAHRLAARLEALDAFSAGLMLLPEGTTLARRLGLEGPQHNETRMRAHSVDHSAVALERFLTAPDWRSRLVLLRAALFPSAQWLRFFYAEQTGRPFGLLRVRVQRPIEIIARVPSAFAERRRHNGQLPDARG